MYYIKIFKAEEELYLGSEECMAMLGLVMRFLPVNTVENQILLV